LDSDANKFGVDTWLPSLASSKTIRRYSKEARSKGVSLKFMMMDQNTFDNMAANEQVRNTFSKTVGSNVPVPDQEQVTMLQKNVTN
jgi:hypothetical protein